MSTERNRRKRANQKRNRHERLELADKEAWRKCSEYHFQKAIKGKLVNWWPSRMKCMIENQVYRVFDEHDMVSIIDSLSKEEKERKA